MNDDRELEDLLRASMKQQAEQMPEIDGVRTRRRRTPVLIAAAASVAVVAAGAVALTSLAPIFSAGSGTSGSASTRLDLGGPRPLFSQEFSAGDGSSAAPASAAAPTAVDGLVWTAKFSAALSPLSSKAVEKSAPLCSAANPEHVNVPLSEVSAIYICHGGSLTQEDGSVWSTAIVDQVVEGMAELLESSGRPDEPPTDLPCTAEGYLTPIITVHSSSGVRNIAPPVDICGKPQPRWLAALHSLMVQKVREVPIEMTQSSLVTETGCSYQFKDMLTLEKPAKAKGSPDPLPESSMRMCVYQSDQSDVGTLIAGLGLSARAVTAINGIYRKIELDPECDPTDHHLFVVLTGKIGWVQIGLDGCGIFGSPGGLWAGSDELRAYLVGLIQNAGQGKALLNR
ncbi:MAG: hypothetical protein NT180_08305 [Actinobacteria bacterium]|nr:hypothetical protein [Actinomycetota bacterium]